MGENMTEKNYLMIQENAVTNVCLWDGDVNSWTPPADAIMLIQETTPTKIWELNEVKTEYVLTDSIGDADIGFTWDGSYCITNKQKPENPVYDIPVTTFE